MHPCRIPSHRTSPLGRRLCLPVLVTLVAAAFPAGSRPARAGDATMPVFLNWDYNCLTLGPEGIAKLVRDARDAGIDGISLRISNKGALNCRTRTGTAYLERLDAFGPDFDPPRVLVQECKRQAVVSILWVDLFEAAYDSLIEAHPEFSPQGRPGKPRLSGAPCYAHPEVRRHMLELVDEYAAYRPDYVFFCTKSSHVPQNRLDQPHNVDSGFNPPVVERYRELYGVDIRTKPFDRQKMGLLRGEFVIDLLVEARKRLHRAGVKMIAGATVSGRLQPTGPNMLLDWRRIVDRRATDILLMANSRSEYYAFYDEKGRRTFAEIRKACDQAGIGFFAYIISSGTHQEIARQAGFAGLLDYLPHQLDYLRRLGGDAVVIHDLDLYTSDPDGRRALWKAAGRRTAGLARAEAPVALQPPRPEPAPSGPHQPLPCGDFEQHADGFWYTRSSWNHEPGSPLANPSMERHASPSRPVGWLPDDGGNPRLRAAYDWRVMHADPDSGRTYHGRASLMLGTQSVVPAGSPTATWTAEVPVPAVAVGNQTVRARAHGESLRAVAAAGMKVESLDEAGNVLEVLDAPAPTEGTYPWRPLEVLWRSNQRAKKLRIAFYLTVADSGQPEGRAWFDHLEIQPADQLDAATLAFPEGTPSEPAFAGRRSARWHAKPGWDLACVPFRAPAMNRGALKAALRADTPMSVTLGWWATGVPKEEGAGDRPPWREKTVSVGRNWQVHEMPLSATEAADDVQVLVRPHQAGTLWLDEVTCEQE